MSLVCCECDQDIQPGEVFPGREGGMLHVNTPSVFGEGVSVKSNQGVAVCFECLHGACTTDRSKFLIRKAFASYNAEVAYVRSGGVDDDAKKSFDAVRVSIPSQTCLCCEVPLPQGSEVFFSFHVMDRVYGESRKSFFGSYQWSYIKTGKTSFLVCCGCAKTHLPRPAAFLTGASMAAPRTPQGSEIVMMDDLSQEQIDLINAHLPKGIRYIG